MPEDFTIKATNSNGIPVTNPQDTRSEEGYLKNLIITGTIDVLGTGQVVGYGSTFDAFGNPINQSFNLSRHGLYFVNNNSLLDRDALLIGDIKTTQVDFNGFTQYYYDPINDIGYEMSLRFQYNGGFTPPSMILRSRDNTGQVTLVEFRGPGSTDPDSLNYGFVKFFRDLIANNKIFCLSTTNSTSKDTGSIITEGGIGVEKDIYVGGKATIASTTEATSKDTGALIVEGGVGIEKNLYLGGQINAPIVTTTHITDVDSPYTVLPTDTHIAVDNNTNPVTINLPTGTNGRKITIFDYVGGANSGTITINRASTNTINGATSTTLTTAYKSVTLLFYNGNWTII